MGCAPGPDTAALKSRGDLHHVSLANPQLDLRRVRHHLDRVPVAAFVDGLGNQGLEARTDLSGREVSRRRDELHPQGHGTLATVAELEDGAARNCAVVNEVEDAHLVQVEDNLEFCGRDDLQTLVAAVDLGEGADEARLLDFHLLEDVLDDLADVAEGLGRGDLAPVNAFVVVFVELEEELGLCSHHLARWWWWW